MQSGPFSTMNSYATQAPQQHKPKPSFDKKKILSFVLSMKFLVVLVVLLQIVIIILIINPINLYQTAVNQQVINEVSKLVTLNPNETPVIAVVSDIDKLKGDNAIQAQVYRDAKNGDYVLGYKDKMVIFRRVDNKVIYDGDSPGTILDKTQKSILSSVVSKSKELGLIENSSEEKLQLQAVVDEADLKTSNPTFYADAQKDDVVALFAKTQKIVLYRPSTNTIIKYGQYNFVIQ